VTFTSGTGDIFTTTTAIDGTYSVQVDPGTYTGVATKEGYASAIRPAITVQRGQAKTGINFILGIPGNIGGTVTIDHEGYPDDGAPLPDAFIEVLSNGIRITSAYTDDDGAYLIEGLATGFYDVRASAVGFQSETQAGVAVVANETATADFQLRESVVGLTHEYAGGRIHLISLPDDYRDYDPANVLHYSPEMTAISLVTWVPTESRYQFYPGSPLDEFRPGRGYWLMTDGPARIINDDTPPLEITADYYNILVQAGWNMIGDPYALEDGVPWADVDVLVGGMTYSVGLAADLGYLQRTLWGWDGSKYVQSSSLMPWQGYWIKASQVLTLRITKPVPPGPPPPPPPPS
jgi:hypothetical protein